jgi:hypothetical protein
VFDEDWDSAYIDLCIQGYVMSDLPSGNSVWGEVLKRKGYSRNAIPIDDEFYTINDFCKEYPKGRYVIGTGTHAVAVVDGDHYDTWDSGDEVVLYVWAKIN